MKKRIQRMWGLWNCEAGNPPLYGRGLRRHQRSYGWYHGENSTVPLIHMTFPLLLTIGNCQAAATGWLLPDFAPILSRTVRPQWERRPRCPYARIRRTGSARQSPSILYRFLHSISLITILTAHHVQCPHLPLIPASS